MNVKSKCWLRSKAKANMQGEEIDQIIDRLDNL